MRINVTNVHAIELLFDVLVVQTLGSNVPLLQIGLVQFQLASRAVLFLRAKCRVNNVS